MKRSVLTTWLRRANDPLRILKAVWEAVHSACATPGKNTDTENAFERLFGLLRRHGNKDFVEAYVIILHPVLDSLVDLYSLEQAKRKDENTIELFAHFSAKYDSYKVMWLV